MLGPRRRERAAAQKVDGVWFGIADDCTKFAANSANPCVALKTKQVADVQTYLNGLGYTSTSRSS